MFRLLGSDPQHKRHRISDDSHVSALSDERIRETLGWFDQYLGQVRRSDETPPVSEAQQLTEK
jgi:hypothetical protein